MPEKGTSELFLDKQCNIDLLLVIAIIFQIDTSLHRNRAKQLYSIITVNRDIIRIAIVAQVKMAIPKNIMLPIPAYRSRQAVKLTAMAKIFPGQELLSELVSLRNILLYNLTKSVKLAVLVDSKDLFGSLSSQ